MEAVRVLLRGTYTGSAWVDRGAGWCDGLGPYAVWHNGGILPSAVGMWREP